MLSPSGYHINIVIRLFEPKFISLATV